MAVEKYGIKHRCRPFFVPGGSTLVPKWITDDRPPDPWEHSAATTRSGQFCNRFARLLRELGCQATRVPFVRSCSRKASGAGSQVRFRSTSVAGFQVRFRKARNFGCLPGRADRKSSVSGSTTHHPSASRVGSQGRFCRPSASSFCSQAISRCRTASVAGSQARCRTSSDFGSSLPPAVEHGKGSRGSHPSAALATRGKRPGDLPGQPPCPQTKEKGSRANLVNPALDDDVVDSGLIIEDLPFRLIEV